MDNPERWIARLGDDASYGADAATRLEARLAGQPGPHKVAMKRAATATAAFLAVSCAAGGVVGALLESRTGADAAALFPAGDSVSPTALLLDAS